MGGVIVGSYYTGRSGRRTEEEKNRRETVKELKSKINVLELVYEELKKHEDLLLEIFKEPHQLNEKIMGKDKDVQYIDTDNTPLDINKQLHSLPEEYGGLTIEEKSNIFNPVSLVKVELAYKMHNSFNVKDDNGYVSYSESELSKLRTNIQEALTDIKEDKATKQKILEKFKVNETDLGY